MDKEAIERIADVAGVNLLLAGAVLEELVKLGYRRVSGEPPVLSEEEIKNTFKGKVIFASSPEMLLEAQTSLIAQAQRDADMRYYTG